MTAAMATRILDPKKQKALQPGYGLWKEYRPSEDDLVDFQTSLRAALQKQGF